MIFHKAENQINLIQKLRTYFPDLFKTEAREAADVVFSVMLIFMLTCIGSMLLICFFFEMDRRSPPPQPAMQQSLLSTANTPIQ
ncbi:MAG: hypothetical protein KME42_26255 [Tildeniella nuda ZEHNDER 1965/U140]|jgi:hypothetical protein|nr:hypothetical protein [Tildeniella nuda ZEHNDER 1965/U140]